MKCLLSWSVFEDEQELIQHYISYHNANQSNWFFSDIISTKKKAVLKQCLRFNDFLTTGDHNVIHNFLKHYD